MLVYSCTHISIKCNKSLFQKDTTPLKPLGKDKILLSKSSLIRNIRDYKNASGLNTFNKILEHSLFQN